MRNRDLLPFGFSRAQASRLMNDRREVLPQLPHRETLDGLAKAFGTSSEFMLGKAIEALGIGYTAADFINEVRTASDQELLNEIRDRLARVAESRDTPPLAGPIAARSGASRGSQLRAVQDEDATGPDPDGPETGA